jgi:dTDP-4-dehydrorhamnose 3,5-epimerase-like enzyme
MKLYDEINFTRIGDERGVLTVAELKNGLPFEVKRIYFLSDLNEIPRGFHAHYTLKQLAVCIQGSCDILFDNGADKKVVTLDSRHVGLTINPMVWHEMRNFSEDCIFLVLASECYEEADYVRDYDLFLNCISSSSLSGH